MTIMGRRAATLLSAILLTMPVHGAAEARSDGEMTQARAGDYYLTKVCKLNEAVDRFWWQMFRGNERVTVRQMRGERFRLTRRAASRMGDAYYTFARELKNPPAPWPVDAASDVRNLADVSITISNRSDAMAASAGARQLFRRFDRWYTVYSRGVDISKRVRSTLDLPRDGC